MVQRVHQIIIMMFSITFLHKKQKYHLHFSQFLKSNVKTAFDFSFTSINFSFKKNTIIFHVDFFRGSHVI